MVDRTPLITTATLRALENGEMDPDQEGHGAGRVPAETADCTDCGRSIVWVQNPHYPYKLRRCVPCAVAKWEAGQR